MRNYKLLLISNEDKNFLRKCRHNDYQIEKLKDIIEDLNARLSTSYADIERLTFLVNCYTNEYFIEKSEIDKDYISKDKIKEKINEIQNMYDKLSKKEHLHSRTECLIVIGELQQLLKEK